MSASPIIDEGKGLSLLLLLMHDEEVGVDEGLREIPASKSSLEGELTDDEEGVL
jgi:hypothetical protein